MKCLIILSPLQLIDYFTFIPPETGRGEHPGLFLQKQFYHILKQPGLILQHKG
jgi:hypothetical protein